MRLPRWARITGKDKRKQYPEQQGVSLGRVGDYTVIFPYGSYADLPADALLLEVAPGVAVPVTVKRPSDTKQGEPVFFHPGTNTRIILKNNGDLDVVAEGKGVNITSKNVKVTADAAEVKASGDVKLEAVNVDVKASTAVNIDSPQTNIGVGGIPIARLGDTVTIPVTSAPGNTSTGTISATTGVNTSI